MKRITGKDAYGKTTLERCQFILNIHLGGEKEVNESCHMEKRRVAKQWCGYRHCEKAQLT